MLSYRSDPYSGGQGVYINNLSRALKRLGHHVEVVSGPPYPLLDDGIPIHQLPSLDLYNPHLYNSRTLFSLRVPTLKELRNPFNLLECLAGPFTGFSEPLTFGLRAYWFLRNKFENYDIIHDNQSFSYGLLAIKRHIPTIATFHHPITVDRDLDIKSAPTLKEKWKYRHWYKFVTMQKRVSRRFRRIITVSECAKNDISRDFGISPDRFRVIPNGINTDVFHPVPGVEKEKNRIIATSSSDTPLKGLRYLLHAVKLVSKNQEIKLTVVGNPKKDSEILKLIGELGIGDLVTFTGRIDHQEYLKQYARSNLAVIPSLYEGFGLPAGEAMACGVPVIATTAGALPEVVGDAGILVPPANAEALAKAISDLLNNQDKARMLAQAGLKRVLNHFSWEKAAKKTIEVYWETIHDYNRL
ncbi:MAG: glycosyltransferase family 4 protein [Deferribacterota bacterium]|nr:glycosyltransferase family 4 protein [Deferribacterota bacterium]